MKTIKTQKQLLKYLDKKTNTIVINDDVEIKCSINVQHNISARDISAGDISALNISARDISVWDISALNISARDISYYAVCFAYQNIKCMSIKGRRSKSKHFCLDGRIIKLKEAKRE